MDDFLANLDDSVRSKLGPESRSIIRSLQDNEKDLMNYENSAQFVASMLAKKNPFNYFRSDKHLFESNVNVAAAKTIEKFSDLFLETENSQDDIFDNGDNQYDVPEDHHQFINGDRSLFRISAYLVGYRFQDKSGIEFFNNAHLRQNCMKMVCISTQCEFVAPCTTFLLPKSFDLMAEEEQPPFENDHQNKINVVYNQSHNNGEQRKSNNGFETVFLSRKPLICPHCQSPMSAYLTLELYLSDNDGNRFTVLLASPEIEKLIGCTNKQLIYSDPQCDRICNALQYALKSLCPMKVSNRKLSSFRKQSMRKSEKKNKNDGSNEDDWRSINPKCQWILESVRFDSKNVNFRDYPNIMNRHLFDSNRDRSEFRNKPNDFRLFFVRSIIINE